MMAVKEDGVTENQSKDDEQPEKPDDRGENRASRAGGNRTNVQLPELPDSYASSPSELYSASARLLSRANKPTTDARIQGVRSPEEATILIKAEANHQQRRRVVAALNERHMELEGGEGDG